MNQSVCNQRNKDADMILLFTSRPTLCQWNHWNGQQFHGTQLYIEFTAQT